MFTRIRLMSSVYQPRPRPPNIWPATMILLSWTIITKDESPKA